MFKKSKKYLLILIVILSVFPAAKAILPEFGGNIDPPVVQTAGQNPVAQSNNASNDTGSISTGSDNESGSAFTDAQNGIITVHFLDVGQADSVLVDFNDYEILIDGGNTGDGRYITDHLGPYVDGNLDLIVATHAHEDHIGGLDTVISAYQVGEIIYSEEASTTKTWQDFYLAADSEPDCKLTGDSDRIFDLGNGAQFKILEMGDGYREPNNNSVVTMIDYNEVEVLLMGDLESSIEKKNLTKFSDVDVLKLGHHGSKTASSQAFLDVVKPEVSIVSAGLDNQYSLPGAEVIIRLQSINSAIYGTFRSGDIIMTTDGVQYKFNTNIQLTLNDAGAPQLTKNDAVTSGAATD